VQVSGRLSPRTADLLGRFPRFAREVLGRVTGFCVQSEAARERLVTLGVDPARVTVTGSLKGDATPLEPAAFLPAVVDLGRPLIVAGSTHEGEEEILLEAARRLEAGSARPFWIIAPRHPERFAPVAALLARWGVRFIRRTDLSTDHAIARAALEHFDMLLLDTIGELRGCFPAATVAFLGGSLAPVGGHNLLEPARAGIPVVVGPHLDSVRETAERLESVGAVDIVRDAEGLAAALARRLADGRDCPAGVGARAVAAEMAGSLARTWECVSTNAFGKAREG
jgi:3-deoxy-D-manno-octulosonic-acid transferase